MCGIVGIIKKEGDVASEIYYGLITQQHRGQDAAGIYVSDGDKKTTLKKGVGLVMEMLKKEDFPKLKGRIGIGHVRYTTAGENNATDAQPFTVEKPVNMAIASNGNIVNVAELSDYLWENNISVDSGSDTEVLLKIFALILKKILGEEKINKGHVFDAARKMMEIARGSYSLVITIEGVGLLAIRDPYAIKPLVFGKSRGNKSYMFASENITLDVLDYHVVRDVSAGEAILIDTRLEVTRRVLSVQNKKSCMFEYVYFARPDSMIDKISVYEVRRKLGHELAKEWMKKGIEADIVIAAPDTARTAAAEFAKTIGLDMDVEGFIKNRYIGRTFIMPDQNQRDIAVKLKLNPIIFRVRNKIVIVIDDSIVRGTTSKQIVELLRGAGAKEVHFLSTCPPTEYQCFYGINTSSKELIAHNRAEDEIRKIIGADSLTYLSIEGLVRAIGTEDLCLACLNGEYPISLARLGK